MTAPNPHLDTATSIFTQLGWGEIPLELTPTHTIGTATQQQQAWEGLESGPFRSYSLEKDSVRWGGFEVRTTIHVDVDEVKLALFALRLGMPLMRVAELLADMKIHSPLPLDAVREILRGYGPDFLNRIVRFACDPSLRSGTHDESRLGCFVVDWVLHGLVSPPESVEFYKDWALFAANVLNPSGLPEKFHIARNLPHPDLVLPQFVEFFHAALRHGVPATGPFGYLLPGAVAHGVVSREQAIKECFRALGSAVRPSHRKRWAQLLVQDFQLSPAHMLPHLDQIVSLVATVEEPMITLFALPLLPVVDSDRVADLAVPALCARSRKTLVAVLQALALRTDDRSGYAEQLRELAKSRDAKVAALAKDLVGHAPEHPQPVVPLWSPAPPTWTTPRFEPGPAMVDGIVANLKAATQDCLAVEKVLAQLVELSLTDVAAAKRAVSGVSARDFPVLNRWTKGSLCAPDSTNGADHAAAIVRDLGTIPCALSRPTWVDFRIDPADLLARLELFQQHNIPARVADFQRALLRLDVTRIPGDWARRCAALTVPVLFDDNTPAPITLAEFLADYPTHVVAEPSGVGRESLRFTLITKEKLPLLPEVFPLIPHAVLDNLQGFNEDHERMLKTAWWLAHQPAPLDSAQLINLLLCIPEKESVAAAIVQAIQGAWSRGLIHPNVARLDHLKEGNIHHSVPAEVTRLKELVELGMLSVVWDIFDQRLGQAALYPLHPNLILTVDAVDEYLPHVPNEARILPGLRALAARKGNAKVVRRAREVVEKLKL